MKPNISEFHDGGGYYANRAAVEYEKKMQAQNLEQSQIMEKHVVSMAHEIEKLQAELADAENRARAAAAASVAGNLDLDALPSWSGSSSPYCLVM